MERPVNKKTKGATSNSFSQAGERVNDFVPKEMVEIFKYKQKDDCKDIINICLKELMISVSRTNLKNTFFIQAKIDEKDRETYNTAKEKVKKLTADKYFSHIRNELKKHNKNVEVKIENRGKGINITVINPGAMDKDEEKDMRRSLDEAMFDETFDISLFYTDDKNSADSASLGLMFIVHLLKSLEVDPILFSIGKVENNAIARIEIPINGVV